MAVPPVPKGIPLAHAAFVNGAWIDTRTQARQSNAGYTMATPSPYSHPNSPPVTAPAPQNNGAPVNHGGLPFEVADGAGSTVQVPAGTPVPVAAPPQGAYSSPTNTGYETANGVGSTGPNPGGPGPGTPGPVSSGGAGSGVPSFESDPEYINALAEANARRGRLRANFDAEQGSVRSRFARMLREAGLRLPQELQGSRESAASRGMLHAGGFLEEQGGINKRFADYNAQIGEDQTTALADLLRQFTADTEDVQFGTQNAMAAAARRAAERAAAAQAAAPAAAPSGEPTPVTTGTAGGASVTPTTAAPATPSPVAAPAPVNPNIATPQNPFPAAQMPSPVQQTLRIPSNPDGSPNNAAAYTQNADGSRTPVNSTTNSGGSYTPIAAPKPAAIQTGPVPKNIPLAHAAFVNGRWIDTRTQGR